MAGVPPRFQAAGTLAKDNKLLLTMLSFPIPWRIPIVLLAVVLGSAGIANPASAYTVSSDHPRIFLTKAGLPELARRCAGPLAEDYRVVKAAADTAVARGSIPALADRWHIPDELMDCGLAYLVERQGGRPHQQYADLIRKVWGDGSIIANPEGSAFGYHALAYDWIYDALSPEERGRYGRALGGWLRFYTDQPEIMLKYGYWEYSRLTHEGRGIRAYFKGNVP